MQSFIHKVRLYCISNKIIKEEYIKASLQMKILVQI